MVSDNPMTTAGWQPREKPEKSRKMLGNLDFYDLLKNRSSTK